MKKIFLLFLVFANLFCQSQNSPCKSTEVLKALLKSKPELQERINAINEQVYSKQSSRSKSGLAANSLPPSESIIIPVVFYIVHDGTASSDISDTQVQQQLTALNAKFLDTGIKFCLATKAGTGTTIPTSNIPNGVVQNVPGIVHILEANLTNHMSNISGQYSLINTAHPSITGSKYLRIWVVKSIDTVNPTTLGYAWFPNGSTFFDGIIMRSDVCGNGTTNLLANYNQGEVLVHEVGHYLGLYHTFEGGCDTPTGDPLEDGDKVDDTPAVNAANFLCTAGTNSCPTLPGSDLINNYMDYGNHVCSDSFSLGQKQRMITMLNTYRSNLIKVDNLLYTGVCGAANLISATITTDSYAICQNGSVSLQALTANAYLWDFGDGATSIAQNPSHQYVSAAESPYTVSLTVTNPSGQSLTSSIQIYVSACNPINDQYSNWYTGINNMLRFNTGLPTFDLAFPNTSNDNATQTSGSISVASGQPSAGQLLFYNNGQNIRNNANTAINTASVTAATATSGRSMIVPNPANSNQYYLFTSGYYSNTSTPSANMGLEYSIVNINSNVATSVSPFRTAVTFPAGYNVGINNAVLGAAGISSIKKCNNEYWILASLVKNGSCYLVTYKLAAATGLTFVTQNLIGSFGGSNLYKIECAPNGNKIFIYNGYGDNYIYDFNKITGVASSQKIISFNPIKYVKSASFSPDSKLLYLIDEEVACSLLAVNQYNLNSSNINATRKIVANITSTASGCYNYDMEMGPDGKIYFNSLTETYETSRLGIIHSPNSPVSSNAPNACQATINGILGQNVSVSLPNNIDARQETAYPSLNNSISSYLIGCNSYKFFPDYCPVSFKWEYFNTDTSTVVSTSSANNPIYTFTQPGNYEVRLKNSSNVLLATIPIFVDAVPSLPISGSTSACTNSSIPNTTAQTNNSVALQPGQSVVWSITPTTAGNIVGGFNTNANVDVVWTTLPATLTATVTDASGCQGATSKTIGSVCIDPLASGALGPVHTLALQSDGKVIVGGNFTKIGTIATNRIARLNPNMTLDNTFVVGTGCNNTVHSSLITSDGNVIIGGAFTSYKGTTSNGLVKISTTNGSIVSAFNIGLGINSGGIVYALEKQSDGQILIGGNFTTYNGTSRISIARLSAIGVLDAGFTTSFMNVGDEVRSIVIQPDGKILVGGYFTTFGPSNPKSILRLNTNGTIDTTFANNNFSDNGDIGLVNSIALQGDGKINVGGLFNLINSTSFGNIARLNTNGTIDTTFQAPNLGVLGGDIFPGVNSVKIDSSGKIIVAGSINPCGNIGRIARLNTNGSFDSTFQVCEGFGPGTGRLSTGSALLALAIQTDGRIICGGKFTSYNTIPVNNIARINPSNPNVISKTIDSEGILTSNEFDKSFVIFPNPNTGNFTIKFQKLFKEYTVSVFDIMGRLVFEKAYTENTQVMQDITLQHPSSGIYFVAVKSGDAIMKDRIIVK